VKNVSAPARNRTSVVRPVA